MKFHKLLLFGAGCLLTYKLYIFGQFWMSATEPASDVPRMIQEQLRTPEGINAVENVDDAKFMRRSALLIAVTQARPDWVKALLDSGADINFQDIPNKAGSDSAQKNTALHYALQGYGNTNTDVFRDIINILLSKGAGVNIPNEAGSPPLHFVPFIDVVNIPTKRRETAELLIQHGADINQQDYMGNTLLHLAVQRDDTLWMQLLLSDEFRKFLNSRNQKLRVAIKNKDGHTPRQLIDFLNFNADFGGPDTPGGTPTMETRNQINFQSLYSKLATLEQEELAQQPTGEA